MRKYSIVFAGLLTSNLLANDAVNICKQEILSSNPYGNNAEIGSPTRFSEDLLELIVDWDDTSLIITSKDGQLGPSIARCVFSKQEGKIVFLNIAADTIISKYQVEVNALKTATRIEAVKLAKDIGLSDGEIEWLKHNGNTNIYDKYYADDAIVFGFYAGKKSEIDKLDKLHIINIYPQGIEGQYLSVSTDLSRIISEKLTSHQ